MHMYSTELILTQLAVFWHIGDAGFVPPVLRLYVSACMKRWTLVVTEALTSYVRDRLSLRT